MRYAADFRSATAEQLVIIDTYLDRAGSLALDYLWKWVNGAWEPDGVGKPPIEWFIEWLDIQEHSGR